MIGRYVGPADQAIDRREIDDAAAACLPQMRDRVLGAEENAFDIDRLDSVPLGFCELMRGFVGAGYARIADHDINTSEMSDDLAEDAGDFSFL